MPPDQPWTPADATDNIRRLGKSARLHLIYTEHAKEQMFDRKLATGDLLFLLKHGFVYEHPVPATRPYFYKYQVESETPNSNGRAVRSVVIPDPMREHVKIVTIMWVTE